MRAQPKYRFYPSLLDVFQEYLDTKPEEFFYEDEKGWHRNYNEEAGTYHLSDEEVDALARRKVLDAINRVGFVSEAADKGSCFNEIVDCIIMGCGGTRDDIEICSKDGWMDIRANGLVDPCDGKVIGGDVDEYFIKCPHIEAKMSDFTFRFDISLCRDAAAYFGGSMCQVFTSGMLDTSYGAVQLYGYADYVRENKVFDAKTTSKYDFGKYGRKWQRHVYPYALIESGKCTDISSFEYTAFKLSGGTPKTPLITGQMFPEVYTFDYEASKAALKNICERFIEFIEANKSEITDKKIFNL